MISHQANSGRLRSLRALFLVLALVVAWVPATFAADADPYSAYLTAYQKYQDAVRQHLPDAQVQAALNEYRAAQQAYENAYNLGQLPTTQTGTGASTDSGAAASVVPTALDAAVAASGNNANSTAAILQTAATTSELQQIVNALNGKDAKKNANALIAKLENYIKNHQGGREVARAKYELAVAYEKLKGDRTTAARILQQLSSDPSAGKLAGLAMLRIRYLQAQGNLAQANAALKADYEKIQATEKKAQQTSWWAFPVKLFRYADYAVGTIKHSYKFSEVQRVTLAYEEVAARFVGSPEQIFNEFEGIGTGDSMTRVRLITDNVESWYARWWVMKNAKSSIDIQYFIVEEDIFGMSMLGVLLEKAKQGVKIRVMLDARGTKTLTRRLLSQRFCRELCNYPNVEIRTFNPVAGSLMGIFGNIRQVMASNHDKIMLVDGEYLIVGGRNIAAHYFVDHRDEPTVYRDCDVLLKGKGIGAGIKLAFDEEFANLRNWEVGKIIEKFDPMDAELGAAVQAMDTFIRQGRLFAVAPNAKVDKRFHKALTKFNEELEKYPHLAGYEKYSPFVDSHDTDVKIIDKHALVGFRNDITAEMVRYMDACKKEIIIQNPYVVLTDRAMAALKRASARGVKIIVHTNSPISSDSTATQAMFYAEWKNYLKEFPTMEIHTFVGERKLHAKVFVFDAKVSMVGTYNMDYISEEVNSEVVAAIDGPAFAKDLRDRIMEDIAVSKKLEIKINADGSVESVYGPDQQVDQTFKTRKYMILILSKLGFLKRMI